MKQKKHTLVILLLVLLAVTAVYAFWVSGVLRPSDQNEGGKIDVGVGSEVPTKIEVAPYLATQGNLVPTGLVPYSGPNSVDEIVVTFNVSWNEDTNHDLAGQYFTGQLTSRLDTGNDGLSSLLNVNISAPQQAITLNGNSVSVTFRFTLNRPSNRAEYELIANTSWEFYFVFSVTLD